MTNEKVANLQEELHALRNSLQTNESRWQLLIGSSFE